MSAPWPGFDVVMTDIDDEALQRGREAIERNLARQVARGRIKEGEKKPRWRASPPGSIMRCSTIATW